MLTASDCVSPIPEQTEKLTARHPRVPRSSAREQGQSLSQRQRLGFSGKGDPRCNTAFLNDGGGSSGLVLGSGGRGFQASPLRRLHLARLYIHVHS
ncbi:hypothetical protein NDU88_009536 [Pleurodeles waltl]|uniref:Uncharacterized protein n=1 Tax=Pleurodeles waltl TaxID=8319 RepID=A0AAV7RWV5_PLEWA|nr:hypothetical protein NDU88_009536 [Pleurodeles waltl]